MTTTIVWLLLSVSAGGYKSAPGHLTVIATLSSGEVCAAAREDIHRQLGHDAPFELACVQTEIVK